MPGAVAGDYQLVFTFQNNLVGTPTGASVTGHDPTGGTGTVTSTSMGPGLNQYTVNLSGVSNAQYLTVTVNGVTDVAGNSGNVVGPQMGVLVGDVTANGKVTNTDVSQVQANVDPTTLVTQAKCKNDVTVNGVVSNTDVSTVQGQVNPTGGLPSTP